MIYLIYKLLSENIYVLIDQTFFCAIDSYRCRDYLEIVSNIQKGDGYLIGLLFPIDEVTSADGPPFVVPLISIIKIISDYFTLIKHEIQTVSEISCVGKEKFIIFKKDAH